MKSTIKYYDTNAEGYCKDTLGLDLSGLYAPFLRRLPATARVLDAGCGSGRDTKHFLNLGHHVTAFDAAPKMVKATKLLAPKAKVIHATFQDMVFENEFDGIWACASLLHVPKNEILHVLELLANALKHEGVLYCSFKLGDTERHVGERLFNDYDVASFSAVLKDVERFKIVEQWISKDLRPEREGQWLNSVLAY
jgi:SAM-dependent methyltransferase